MKRLRFLKIESRVEFLGRPVGPKGWTGSYRTRQDDLWTCLRSVALLKGP